jgi:hypothetical protein
VEIRESDEGKEEEEAGGGHVKVWISFSMMEGKKNGPAAGRREKTVREGWKKKLNRCAVTREYAVMFRYGGEGGRTHLLLCCNSSLSSVERQASSAPESHLVI